MPAKQEPQPDPLAAAVWPPNIVADVRRDLAGEVWSVHLSQRGEHVAVVMPDPCGGFDLHGVGFRRTLRFDSVADLVAAVAERWPDVAPSVLRERILANHEART